MRYSAFGDPYVDSLDDDIGTLETLQDASEDIYAVIFEEGGEWSFEVYDNGSEIPGSMVVASDPIFETANHVVDFLIDYVTDIDFD